PDGGVPGSRRVPGARDPDAAHRRKHRGARHGAAQRQLFLQPRSEGIDRQGAGDDRAGPDAGARRDSRLGDAVGPRAGVRHDLEDEILAMATRRILYFTAEDHYLYRSAGAGLELETKFSGDDLGVTARSEEHTSELQSRFDLVCRLLLEKKNK